MGLSPESLDQLSKLLSLGGQMDLSKHNEKNFSPFVYLFIYLVSPRVSCFNAQLFHFWWPPFVRHDET